MNINPFINVIATVLNLYTFVLIATIVMSWLIHFNIINAYQPFVSRVMEVLYRVTEPVLRPIRRYMPNLGGIDISPIVLFLLIQLITDILYTYFYTRAF